MRKGQMVTDLRNKRAYGVQSLDIYVCDRKAPRRDLVGLRCGEVMEAVVQEQEKEGAKALSKQILKQRPLLAFEFYSYISAHSSL